MPATVYYQDEKKLVSSTSFVVDGTTYLLKNINSVSCGEKIADRMAVVFILVFAFLHAIFNYGLVSKLMTGIRLVDVGIFVVIAIIVNFLFYHDEYYVYLDTSEGKKRVLKSKKSKYAEVVATALDKALKEKK